VVEGVLLCQQLHVLVLDYQLSQHLDLFVAQVQVRDDEVSAVPVLLFGLLDLGLQPGALFFGGEDIFFVGVDLEDAVELIEGGLVAGLGGAVDEEGVEVASSDDVEGGEGLFELDEVGHDVDYFGTLADCFGAVEVDVDEHEVVDEADHSGDLLLALGEVPESGRVEHVLMLLAETSAALQYLLLIVEQLELLALLHQNGAVHTLRSDDVDHSFVAQGVQQFI